MGNYSIDPTHTAEDVISQQGKLTMQVVFSTARANQTMNAGFETGHGKLKWSEIFELTSVYDKIVCNWLSMAWYICTDRNCNLTH